MFFLFSSAKKPYNLHFIRYRLLAADRKLAHWKVVLAGWIKLQCGVSNRWLSENLYMGNIYSISKAVAAETKTGSKRSKEWIKLGMPKSKA